MSFVKKPRSTFVEQRWLSLVLQCIIAQQKVGPTNERKPLVGNQIHNLILRQQTGFNGKAGLPKTTSIDRNGRMA